jgi:hypothetical protein
MQGFQMVHQEEAVILDATNLQLFVRVRLASVETHDNSGVAADSEVL